MSKLDELMRQSAIEENRRNPKSLLDIYGRPNGSGDYRGLSEQDKRDMFGSNDTYTQNSHVNHRNIG